MARAPGMARAQGEVPLAEMLYQNGRELMAQGNFAEACPKLAESYRLDPATGTLLNLAGCHEGEGKLASAWVEYMDAARASRRGGRPDRVRFAEEHANRLAPRLSRLTIVVAPGAEPADLQITLDGAVVGKAVFGVAAPLDPGTHVVVATAAGRRPFTHTLVLGPEADQQTVTVSALALAEPQAPVAPSPDLTPLAPADSPASSPRAAKPPPTESTIFSTPVLVAGGATLALAAATIVTGVVYAGHRSDYRAATDPEKRRSEFDSARAFGVANAVLLAGTVVGGGFTTYFVLTREGSTARARLAPTIVPGFAGVVAGGEF